MTDDVAHEFATEADELAGKTIERVKVYSDIALIALTDGSMVDVRMVAGEIRVEVRNKFGGVSGDGPIACRVYRGGFPYPQKARSEDEP